MIEISDKKNCCGCEACSNVCPVNAISMIEDDKGFKYPIIDTNKCIKCNKCNNVCPIINKQSQKSNKYPDTYACINKDENVRIESSSGGIFTSIAEYILNQNGVVFGAKFDNNYNVVHDYIDDKNELYKFRGSKYVQSSINNSYIKAREFLEEGKKVLFTGTPCQIAGLKKFLNKDYENLYTQDIICHGVPSNKVWKKYLKEIAKENGITNVNFRDKEKYGWNHFSLKIKTEDYEQNEEHSKDNYMRAFLRNVSLRDSCYSCKFKEKIKDADITLADFWGIKNILPKINDEKGTSLVFLNSKKGKEIFNCIKDKILFFNVDFDNVLKYNMNMIKSATENGNREKFFEELDKYSMKELIKRNTKNTGILKRIIRKLKK